MKKKKGGGDKVPLVRISGSSSVSLWLPNKLFPLKKFLIWSKFPRISVIPFYGYQTSKHVFDLVQFP